MPLPDERPRQSVANLIGRFEKQKTPSNGPPPPTIFQRTSSVASHRTGDSVVEELKEKREWPPKRTEATTVTPSMPSPGKESIADLPSIPISNEKEPEVVEATHPEPSPPAVTPPSPPEPVPAPTLPPSMPPKTKSTTSTSNKPSTSTPNQPSTSTPNKPSTPRTPAATKPSTLKSTTKPASTASQKSTANASTSVTPLKPQTTGQSASSTRTPAYKSATPAKHATTVTPRAKTPSTLRAKSPASTRPKTPSSGLFAPTAASLARARNAPEPPPPEKPKRKLTTDLSKPTAASASKVRAPIPVPSPPKVTKTPAPRTSTSRPSTGTGKSTSQATPGKAVAIKPAAKARSSIATPAKNGNAKAAPTPKATIPTTVIDKDALEEHKGTEDTLPEEVSHVENPPIESYDDDFVDNTPVEPEEDVGDSHEDTADVHLEEHVEGADDANDVSHSEAAEDDTTPPNGEPHVRNVESTRTDEEEDTSPVDNTTEDDTIHVNAATKLVGNDLDDLVNMLETVPQVHRPELEPTVNRSISDTGEIPDEY